MWQKVHIDTYSYMYIGDMYIILYIYVQKERSEKMEHKQYLKR